MELIYPMFAMVLLTFVVGAITAYVRITSAYSGVVDPRYFKLMANYEIPDKVAKFGRNFDNLFEVPVLFYAVCICFIALRLSGAAVVYLAWAFVGLRVVHTLIHLTYNHPLHRFVPFVLSFLCVFAMWVSLILMVGGVV